MLFLGFISGKKKSREMNQHLKKSRFSNKYPDLGMAIGCAHWQKPKETKQSMFSKSSQTGYLLVNLDFCKVLAHFPGNLILLPEMKPRNNIVY